MQVGLSPSPLFHNAAVFNSSLVADHAGDGTAESLPGSARAPAATQQAIDAGSAEQTNSGTQEDARSSDDRLPGARDRAEEGKKTDEGAPGKDSSATDGLSEKEFSEEETRIIESLQRRDRAVRAHEAAHLAAAGRYANGGASYSTEVGPDGRTYAIGGEVPIDMSAEQTPEATLMKALTLQAAALAPSDPSGADRAVAAAAAQMARRAMVQMSRLQQADGDVPELGATDAAPKSSEATNDGESDKIGLASETAREEPESRSRAAENRREQLSRAYAAMSATSGQGTLKCPACDSIH